MLFLRPQNSFSKKFWIEYANEIEKQNKILKSHLIIKTCEKLYWSLIGNKTFIQYITPIQYTKEAREELISELPDIFDEKEVLKIYV
jgi:hypothetical protein